MNQREFYERIYNYKHGIKEDNDTIQHSAKGDEWDSHKYKDKIYLGSGRYRYIYDDGTESTGYSPLSVDDEVRVKQRSQQTANTAQGISDKLQKDTTFVNGKKEEQEARTSGTPSTASQIGSFLKDNVGTQSPSNPEFSQARKESYAAEGYDKAPKSAPIPYAKLDAQAKEGEKMAALYGGTGGQVKPNTGTLGSGIASDTAKQTTAPNFAQGLRTNIAQTTLSDSTNIGNKQQPNFNPAVGQSRSNEAIDIGNFLTQNVQNPTNPEYTAPQGAPYSELQKQSINTTRDSQARKIVDDYLWQLEEDVYDPLKRAGYSDDYIWGIIDAMESSLAGEAISKQLAYTPRDTNIMFFPGAEEGLQVYLDKVLPILKKVAATATPAQNSPKVDTSVYDPDVKTFGDSHGKTAADVMQAYKRGGVFEAVNAFLDSDQGKEFANAARGIANNRGLSDDGIFDINTYKNFYGSSSIPDDWIQILFKPANDAREYMSGDEYDDFSNQIEAILRSIVNDQGINDYYKNKN